MKKCHQNTSPYLFDSCDPTTLLNGMKFLVDPGEAVIVTICGLPAGQTIPVEQAVGPIADACWELLTVGGVTAALSADNTVVKVSIEGWYRLGISGVAAAPGTCVRVTAQSMPAAQACCIPGPFSELPVEPCPPLNTRGFLPA